MKYLKFVLISVLVHALQLAYTQDLFFDREGLISRKMDSSLINDSDMVRLIKRANQILDKSIQTVVHKSMLPPSGDKHDYYSHATYWWPDKKSKTGLPYVRIDGKPNPSRLKISDHQNLKELAEDVKILSLAYFFTDERKYVKKIEGYLEAWFISQGTKMNPNLEFAQGVPGHSQGSIVGTIDTRVLPEMLDALNVTGVEQALEKSVLTGAQAWFKQFLSWLTDSPMVKGNLDKIDNNIGTAYYMQIISYEKFVADPFKLDVGLKSRIYSLLDAQFTVDGIQKHESTRARSSTYALSNLIYWNNISMLFAECGIDLWNYQTPNGNGLKSVYDFWYDNVSVDDEQVKLDNRSMSLINRSNRVYRKRSGRNTLNTENFITNLTSSLY